MRFDYLATPISETSPTGPDLDEEADNDYFNYVLPAGDRLPSTSYFDQRTGEPFDRSSVELGKECDQIADLLDRSRDIRLLVLEARFQANAGTLSDFADCLEGIALLLETFWAEAHPRPGDDGFLRLNTLAGLDGAAQYVMPLQFMKLTEANRHVAVTYRDYMLALGQAQPRGAEEVLAPSQVRDALTAPENRETLLAAHEDIQRALTALDRIDKAFADNIGDSVGLTVLPRILQQIDGMITSHVEGLASAEAAVEAGPAGAANGMATTPASPAPKTHNAQSPIQSRADAAQALACIEAYYLSTEPAALAMLLVHQARLLEGRPLVEAIEALAPGRANAMEVRLDNALGFKLDIERLRAVSEDVFANLSAPMEEPNPNPAIWAETREQASELMGQVEAYYRVTEPASPIPLLLSRARSSATRDFLSILNDLLPEDSND
jgi:type VI secretion system protein ImpA